MKRTIKRSVLGGIAAATMATTLLAPPAQAEYYSIDDPDDASASLTDIYGLNARHGTEVVTAAVTFADLRRDSAAGLSVFFDTDRSRRGPEYVLNSGLGDGTDYALTRARRWKGRGEPIDCDYEARVKWGMDRFRALVARECLGGPGRVRVSVRMADTSVGGRPVVDWAPARRRWSLWLDPGSSAATRPSAAPSSTR
jgi:hypothetical protein